MKTRRLEFSVTVRDCEIQTFRSGGPGGQNQNKRETGVRIIHHPSGARGESREGRTQYENKRLAFKRMGESRKFKLWVEQQFADKALLEQRINEEVEKQMRGENLRVEFYEPEEED